MRWLLGRLMPRPRLLRWTLVLGWLAKPLAAALPAVSADPAGATFLRRLKGSLPRLTVVWDRHNIHSKARLVKAFLRANPSVVAEDFPGYVPDLNPDEGVWGWTKYGRLANFAPAGTADLRQRVQAELTWLKAYPYFLYSFIEHTNLPLQL